MDGSRAPQLNMSNPRLMNSLPNLSYPHLSSVSLGMQSARNTGVIFDPPTSCTTQIQTVRNIYWFYFLNLSQVCLHRSTPIASTLVQHLSGSFLTTTTCSYHIIWIPSNPVPYSCHFGWFVCVCVCACVCVCEFAPITPCFQNIKGFPLL